MGEYEQELYRREWARQITQPLGIVMKECVHCRRGIVFALDISRFVLANAHVKVRTTCPNSPDGNHRDL